MIKNRKDILPSGARGPDMEIIQFEAPVRFQDYLREYLVQHEAENNLFLGILAGIIAGEYPDIEPYQGLIREGGQIRAAALCTPPHPVILSYQNPPPEKKVLKALLRDFQERLGDNFNGLSGNKEIVAPLVDSWQRDSGREARLEMGLRIYKLNEVIPVKGVAGKMRPVERADRQLLLDWYTEFQRDAMNTEPNPRRVKRQVKIYLEADPQVRGLRIWEVNGNPVSMAGYAGPTPHGIRIGAVYTPPEQRRKGYASACTASLSQQLLDQGREFCFLFTDRVNPTSNHIYQRIGYQPICDVDRFIF